MLNYEHVADLIVKYKDGKLTDDEIKRLSKWVCKSKENVQLFERLINPEYIALCDKQYKGIDADSLQAKLEAKLGFKICP